MELTDQYNKIIEQTQAQLSKTKKQILNISSLRVLLFILGIIGIIILHNYAWWILIAVILCTFVPFIFLVKYHSKLFNRKSWQEKVLQIYQDETKALNNDLTPFDGGEEYINPSHDYSYDLDLFGNNHSLFQALNRTSTQIGKDKLAYWLNNHSKDINEISEREEAVKEIAPMLKFREEFRVYGLLHESKKDDYKELEQWINMPSYFLTKRWVKFTIWAVPSINIITFILYLCGIVSIGLWGFCFLSFVILSSALIKKIGTIQNIYENKLKILSSYSNLIRIVESKEYSSSLLKRLKQNFYINNKASEDVIGQLNKYLERLDLKNHQLLYAILEGTMFWQLRQIYFIEKWKDNYGKNLLVWISTLSEFDAIFSLANFAYNHPQYSYPTLRQEPFVFKAQDMGHPLMDTKKCVVNNANIPYKPFFLIITGANMAGKSTYLRTVGINYVLACIGAPVFCTSLELSPSQLTTSLRTTDSLSNNESYFFAEIKRLSIIVERLKRGEEMFIILDEILKGTNSIDKQKGSFSLIKQLISLKANGIIATHDLMLGELENIHKDNIKNYRFEADIINNELSFSYKLREGIAQNMNACFLMKKMGLMIEDK